MVLRYEMRAATPQDADAILALARFLDSVNLPNDPDRIMTLLKHSEDAFSARAKDPRKREYVFALWDLEKNRIVGTSMIIGQLGRRDAPYIYLDVTPEERYSVTLDKHFYHHILSIGYSFNGPTEIGGLVVHPDYRRSKEKVGRLISYVRFLWIAAHSEWFQKKLLAELLPPLEADGTSHLWEAVGKRFTALTYKDADRLSKVNKEFIRSLFPDGEIHCSLLSQEAQDVIGKVGVQSQGVEKLLSKIGFQYVDRVDPFDGGPHFMCKTEEVSLIKAARFLKAEAGELLEQEVLLGVEYPTSPWFRAISTKATLQTDRVIISNEAYQQLALSLGSVVMVTPLPA